MKQPWVNKQEKLRLEKIERLKNEIRTKLLTFGPFSEPEVNQFMDKAIHTINIGLTDPSFMIPHDETLQKRFLEEPNLWVKTREFLHTLPYEELAFTTKYDYYNYLDSEPKHYHGDIIITDPCYVIKDNDWDAICDDQNTEINGLPGTMMRDTIFGDWSCTTLNTITKEPIGHFCADAGMVAVFNLAEVLRYNPKFDYHKTKDWTTTLIENFDGTCQFIIKHHTGKYGDDFSVHIKGTGINFVTNEPIEFITFQSGF